MDGNKTNQRLGSSISRKEKSHSTNGRLKVGECQNILDYERYAS